MTIVSSKNALTPFVATIPTSFRSIYRHFRQKPTENNDFQITMSQIVLFILIFFVIRTVKMHGIEFPINYKTRICHAALQRKNRFREKCWSVGVNEIYKSTSVLKRNLSARMGQNRLIFIYNLPCRNICHRAEKQRNTIVVFRCRYSCKL